MDKQKDASILEAIKKAALIIHSKSENDLEEADKEKLFFENLLLKERIKDLENTLTFIKNTYISVPELTLYKDGRVAYKVKDEIITEKLAIDKNEHRLLKYFIQHHIIPASSKGTQALVDVLNKPRSGSDSSSKKRILDTVTQLKNKFGKNIIIKLPNGTYVFFAKVRLS